MFRYANQEQVDEIHEIMNLWQGDEEQLVHLVSLVQERLLAIKWDARMASGFFYTSRERSGPGSAMKHYWVIVFENNEPKVYVDIFNPFHHMFVIPMVHPLAKRYEPHSISGQEHSDLDLTEFEEWFDRGGKKKEKAEGEPKVKKPDKPSGKKNNPFGL